ncbi:MAG TPA: hypothetical protein VG733_13790 [Chthoniobacteraceae bacterium]|nr:hypothetical protein [Chthoniobacteraceae bacterium]
MKAASQPAKRVMRFFLANAALPLGCLLAIYAFDIYSGYQAGRNLSGVGDVDFMGLGLLLWIPVMLGLLVIGRYRNAAFWIGTFVVFIFCNHIFKLPSGYTANESALKSAVRRTVDIQKMKDWVFSQKLPSLPPIAPGGPSRTYQTYKRSEVPEFVTRGFPVRDESRIMVDEFSEGDRSIMIDGVCIDFRKTPSSNADDKVEDGVYVCSIGDD